MLTNWSNKIRYQLVLDFHPLKTSKQLKPSILMCEEMEKKCQFRSWLPGWRWQLLQRSIKGINSWISRQYRRYIVRFGNKKGNYQDTRRIRGKNH